MRLFAGLSAVWLVVLWLVAAPTSASAVDPALLAGVRARAIGPAGMSGRVAVVEAVPSDPDVLYVGAASGGVWKSSDGGVTFEPVFDDEGVHSIGAIAVDPSNPDVVWVGTGEGNPRNSASVGDGVYQSRDGGRSWRHLGLAESERIHRLLLHPARPGTAYVCALGKAWSDSAERGVFKTVDGGVSWQKVLYVDERTGCGDLAIDPVNPDKLLAGLWEFRRRPWHFTSGGPGSGVYLTYDGGATWKRLSADDGLPAGELGRTGLAISRSQPRNVYALVEATKSVLLRSRDGGESWAVVNSDPREAERPFYFADLRVDPEWPERLYNLRYELRVSDDGGRTFRTLEGAGESQLHVDHHALWIHPEDPTLLYDGSDGGVGISRDRGESFRMAGNLPLAQLYHVAVDQETPYNVYMGLQDNGSWRGPSAVWERGGVRNHHWRVIGDGDGFDARPDPDDPSHGYSMWQGGQLYRWNLATGEMRGVRPPPPGDEELRFNWDAGFAVDPFDSATIYLGSQYLHRSRDRGETWEVISGDLTTDNPEWQQQATSGGLTLDVTMAEGFTTITAVAPSPLERGTLWVGTDDGRLQLTRDHGGTWTSLEARLPGAPKNGWIPFVAPSPHAAGTAFVVVDDHRRGDLEPYVFRTDDHGATWRRLPTAGVRGWALAIVQDPATPELLYLGTELGLWLSLDGGAGWTPFRHGLPTAAVIDLTVHPREHDLVIGTHGRAVYILDDVRPLRALTPAALAAPLHLFAVAPAQQHWRGPQAGDYGYGADTFQGENRPYGAIVTFALNLPGLPPHPDPDAPPPAEKPEDDKPEVTIEVADADGRRLRTVRQPAYRGVNRAVWDLARDAFKQPPWQEPAEWQAEAGGPEVPPGDYRLTVRIEGHEASTPVTVLADPRSSNTAADWQRRWQTALRLGALQDRTVDAILRLRRTRADVAAVAEKLRQQLTDAGERDPRVADRHPLITAGDALSERLQQLEAELWVSDERQGIPAETDVLTALWYLDADAFSSWTPPSPTHLAAFTRAESLLDQVLTRIDALYAADVAAYRGQVQEAGIALLPELPPLAESGLSAPAPPL